MKIDFSQTITVPGAEPLTLSKIAVTALNAPGREALTLEQSLKRGNLILKIVDGGEHDVTPEDVAEIRKQLPASWSPIVVALACKHLDA